MAQPVTPSTSALNVSQSRGLRVVDHLHNTANPTVSVEIIPPKRGGNLAQIDKAIQSILHFNPPFIDVTSHAAEIIWEEQPDGTYRKTVKRKSPGTFGLCAAIKYRYGLEPVPHVLCGGFTREETEDALIELNYLGIHNILAIRGDKRNPRPIPADRSENKNACELVAQVADMNSGKYLDANMVNAAQTDFCIGVAYYPEKHFESPNLDADLKVLKNKFDLGAHYGVSQMFYDNQKYFAFIERTRAFGIEAPLMPGLKILTSKRQLRTLPPIFYIDIPQELCDRMNAAKTREEEIQVGVDWAYQQSVELLESGVKNLHYYIMQNTKPFLMLMEKLKKQL